VCAAINREEKKIVDRFAATARPRARTLGPTKYFEIDVRRCRRGAHDCSQYFLSRRYLVLLATSSAQKKTAAPTTLWCARRAGGIRDERSRRLAGKSPMCVGAHTHTHTHIVTAREGRERAARRLAVGFLRSKKKRHHHHHHHHDPPPCTGKPRDQTHAFRREPLFFSRRTAVDEGPERERTARR